MHAIYQPKRTARQMIRESIGVENVDPTVKPALVRHCTLRYRHVDGSERIRYHDTDIVIRRPNGSIEIDAGGYGHSFNTRERIGEGLAALTGIGHVVWPDKKSGGLSLSRRNPGCVAPDRAGPYWLPVATFANRLTIGPRGKVKSDLNPERSARLRNQIDAYLAAWSKKGVPSPAESAGDPLVFSPAAVDRETMLGWVRSRYVARRILTLAVEDAGRNPFAWIPANGGPLSSDNRRWLRRFVKRCLGVN